MWRAVIVVAVAWEIAVAQALAPSEPAALAAPVDVQPLRPPDLATPYASPRDAARHMHQATMANLQAKRDTRAAVRGFGQALVLDPTYALAAFDLGVVAAISERFEDAMAAFEEAVRLDPQGLGTQANPQLQRLRLISELEKTPEGKRRRQYEEALLPVLIKLPKLPEAQAMADLAEVGRLDPKRWEAPALLAGLNGNGQGYETAAKFLEISVANAPEGPIKTALQKALKACEREMRFRAARAAAEMAADAGDHAKAAELFEAAWTAIPARAGNGLDAASELLLLDDTAKAAALLSRLTAAGDATLVEAAGSMLKTLEVIEPAAKNGAGDGAQFFKEPGAAEPVRIASLIPPVDRTEMEVLARPLPKLAADADPVVLLAALSTDPAETAQAGTLPVLAEPSISFENAWRDIQAARQRNTATEETPPEARNIETIELAKGSKTARVLKLTSQPPGARVFLDDRMDAVCQTPCNVQAEAGPHTLRLSLAGYKEDQRRVSLAGRAPVELAIPFEVMRGMVMVETPGPAALKVNGTAIPVSAPATLALLPGLHRLSAEFGTTSQERVVMVKPGARLKITFRP